MSYRDKFADLEELLDVVNRAILDGVDKDKLMTIVDGLILNDARYKYGYEYSFDISTSEIYEIVEDSDFDLDELATMLNDDTSLMQVLEELSSLSYNELIAAKYRIAKFFIPERKQDD